MRDGIRKILPALLVLTLSVPCYTTWGGTTDLGENTNPAGQGQAVQLEEAMMVVAELRGQINRTAFDLEAELDHSEYEAGKIIYFVKSQIAFEQYPGTLRGAKGTLVSRAGNALDQSLLLAKLLRDAGYDARIAHSTLAPPAARLLLKEMLKPRSSTPPVKSNRSLEGALKRLSELAGLGQAEAHEMAERALSEPDIESTQAFNETQKTAALLERELESAGISLAAGTIGESLVKEASDYYWVQMKPNVAEDWQDIHPSFAREPGISPKAERFLTESVPRELQHRVRLEMVIEFLLGKKLESVPVMSPYERPAANLFDQPLILTNVPDGFTNTEVAEHLDEALEQTNYFMPFLNNTLAPGGKFFDAKGHALSPEDASSPYSAVFATVGDKAGEAASALGQLGLSGAESDSALPPQALTAQWIDVTIIGPGGSEVKHRRTVFDRLGASGRMAIRDGKNTKLLFNETEMKRKLTMTMRFAIGVGRQSEAFVADSQLKEVEDLQPVWSALAANQQTDEFGEALLSAMATPRPWQGGLKLLQLFDVGAARFGAVNYRSAPTVLAHRQEFPWEGEVTALVDIISNERRVFGLSNDQIRTTPLAAMKTGIWETLLEGAVLPREVVRSTNTVSLLEEAKAQGFPLTVVKPGQTLGNIAVSADTAQSLKADLGRGYAAIVPERSPSSGRWDTAWWRVNPLTGVTTGVAGSGEGLEIVDYVIIGTIGAAVLTAICVGAQSGRSGEAPDGDDVGICGSMTWGGAMTLIPHPLAKAFGLVLLAFGTGWWLGT